MSAGTILVVEDEFMIASATKLLLEDQGYRVVIAANGPIGLARVQAERFDLVITDYMMPLMDGLTLSRTLRERGFSMPILLSSAIPEARLPQNAPKSYDGFIEKPYVDGALLRLVRQLIERGASRS